MKYIYLYNVGLRQRIIFRTSQDFSHFLVLVSGAVKKYKNVHVIGYVLLANQYHLLVQADENNDDVSSFMHWLNVSYAMYFNNRYDTKGKVFAGPYKSTELHNIDDMMRWLTYMHKLPTSCNNIRSYRWSSYLAYIRNTKDWLHKEPVLSFFLADQDSLSIAVRDFTLQVDTAGLDPSVASADQNR